MIQHFLITVLVIYGVHGTTREGMILWPFSAWVYIFIGGGRQGRWHSLKMEAIAEKASKVLFDCTPCMASIYGTLSYFLVEFPTHGFDWWLVWVFSLSGFNYILNKFMNK